MLTFADFVAKAHGAFREMVSGSPKCGIETLDRSHIFYLGGDDDFNQGTTDINSDLMEEMKARVPMPFKDIACVSLVTRAMTPEREAEFNQSMSHYAGPGADLVRLSGGPVWVMDRVIEVGPSHPMIRQLADQPYDGDRVNQWFIFARVQGVEGLKAAPLVWGAGYTGVRTSGQGGIVILESAASMVNEVTESLRYITAISHPANYILKVTPKLTPHETRRVEAGKRYPDGKASHFLVVDHDVIVGMRRDPVGTHASPVPHERRGHWRRLGEHCRHAKLLGKGKVYVRPALVGEPKFEDAKNLYEVLPDFGKKETAHVGF